MLSTAGKRLVGITAIFAAIGIVVLGTSKPNPFRDVTTYYAELDSVQGLGAIGRDIRIAGVNVGTIGEVERDGDDAVVELELDGEVQLRSDARVAMRPHTLFEGSSFVDLSPGSPSAEPIPEGSVIPNAQTTNYVTLDEAFRILRSEIRNDLKQLAEAGSKTLRGAAIGGIQRTLRNSPELTRRSKRPARALQGSSRRELGRAILGISQTVDAVARREADLIPLNSRLSRTAAALTVDRGRPLDAAIAALPGALRELDGGAPVLTGLVDRLDRLAVAVNPALPDLAVAVGDATPLLERSIPLLRKTTPIIGDLRKIGARVGKAAPTLAQLVRTIDPVADVFGGSVLPVLHAPSRNGPPTYRQLVATFTAANAVFRPYQTPTQNPNGTGHLWQIGTYGEDSSPGSGSATAAAASAVDCDAVAAISPRAARQLRTAGVCE